MSADGSEQSQLTVCSGVSSTSSGAQSVEGGEGSWLSTGEDFEGLLLPEA